MPIEQASTILIVDDDKISRRLLTTLLGGEGYRLVTADNGAEALERAAQVAPDLIMLDVVMPGIDGYEVCRRLRADRRLAEVPVMMVTALNDRESRLRGIEAGADDFIAKPFDRAELRARVRAITRLNRYRLLLEERTQLQEALTEIHRRNGELELLNGLIAAAAAAPNGPAVLRVGCQALAQAFAPARAEAQLWPEGRAVASAESPPGAGAWPETPRTHPAAGPIGPEPRMEVVDLPDPIRAGRAGAGPTSPAGARPAVNGSAAKTRAASATRAGAPRGRPPDPAPEPGSTPWTRLTLPICVRDRPVAAITLLALGERRFETQDLALARSIGGAVGQALGSTLLHEHLHEHAEGLEEIVAERTLELQRERDRTRAILEALGEAVVVTDVAGVIEYANPAVLEATGFEPEEVLGQNVRLWHPDRRLDGVFEELARDAAAGPWRGEIESPRKDGTTFPAVLTIAPFFDSRAGREVVGFVGVQRDITPLRRAEWVKHRFVSNISHELRTPLSIITLLGGNLDTLYERLDDPQRRAMIRDIRKHAQVLDELIGDVLEISRIDSGDLSVELAPLNWVTLIREEVARQEPLAAPRGLRISLDGPESLMVKGDPELLRRVLRNLLNNAIKYNRDGGRVTCTWRAFRAPRRPGPDWPGGAALAPGPWAALRIADSGIGIAPEHLPHIFERFYRVNTKGSIPGTGLGLSITHELVELHAGSLAAASRPGRGSTFAVYLPLLPESPAP